MEEIPIVDHTNQQNQGCDSPVEILSGHRNEVSAIRFLPKGERIISTSRDNTVKIWSLGKKSKKLMMTYKEHLEAVKDICISQDGTKFVTAGEDKKVKYWDTETGRVETTFSTEHIPNVVKLKPSEHKQTILLGGMSDKKIVQWDLTSGSVVHEYDQHMDAVNTIEFLDNSKRFVSTSQDESLRVWECGMDKTIMYICEPHLRSTYSTSVHPNGKWLATQSCDKKISVYDIQDGNWFRLNEEREFVGHDVDTYACQLSISPDGQYIISGDSRGKLWIWNWDTCQTVRTLQCHNGVCVGAQWHPARQGFVATCGSDKTIKYWDISHICN